MGSLGRRSDVRLGVLASGGGTILEAIIEDGLEVTVVVTDRECRALEVARAGGVPRRAGEDGYRGRGRGR